MTSLPILLIEAHSRCNCRCEMCDIWKSSETHEFSVAKLEQQLESIDRLGTRWVVFTGGEPLMHSDFFALCKPLRARGIEVSILSTGLLFERYAAQIVANLDSAIVSLDGPPDLHDSIRRVPGAFDLLARGIQAIHTLAPGFPISARSVVQRRNHAHLTETTAAAKSLNLKSISFLAADVTSPAFARDEPWPILRQNEIALHADDLPALEHQLTALARDPFVIDSPTHLRRIAHHFRAHLGMEPHIAPRCNAPDVSVLLGASGAVKPCFFQPQVGSIGNANLFEVLNAKPASNFRAHLDVANNPICQKCVCSLHLQ